MKRKGILLLVLALVLTMSVSALDLPDPAAEGTITLTLKPGGKISLFYVADIQVEDWNFSYQYTDTFSQVEEPITEENIESEAMAKLLWTEVSGHYEPDRVYTLDKSGTVTTQPLKAGLYLVGQTGDQCAKGYLPINPFLVSIPLQGEDGTWDYTVDATPKMTEPEYAPSPSPRPSTPPKPTPKPIPDTGQLNWPVPVLAASGLLIFALGWGLSFAGRKQDDET